MQVNPFPFKRPVRIEMVPLIDMFFLVLTFFIFGVFSMTIQRGILVDLPRASTATSAREETVPVSVTADGAVLLRDEPVSVAQLAERLRAEDARHPEALVLVNADQAARHGLVIAVLDAVRDAGLQRVTFATEPER